MPVWVPLAQHRILQHQNIPSLVLWALLPDPPPEQTALMPPTHN